MQGPSDGGSKGPELSNRERQIARFVVDGLTNKEIAHEIHLNVRAVGFHLYGLMQKIGANRRDDVKPWMVEHTPNPPPTASSQAVRDVEDYSGEQEMPTSKESPTKERRKYARCSFCGKGQDQVRKLVAGPGVFICDQCISLCNEVLQDPAPAKPWDEREGALADLLLDLLRRDASDQKLSDTQRKAAVDQLRANGVTWTRIGEAFGLSRQEAWERFSGED